MTVDFQRITWVDYPQTDTPLDADNLNRIEEGIAGLYHDLNDVDFTNIHDTLMKLLSYQFITDGYGNVQLVSVQQSEVIDLTS